MVLWKERVESEPSLQRTSTRMLGLTQDTSLASSTRKLRTLRWRESRRLIHSKKPIHSRLERVLERPQASRPLDLY
jgi:hypothetical protein